MAAKQGFDVVTCYQDAARSGNDDNRPQYQQLLAASVSQFVDHGECFHAVKDNKIKEGAIFELGNVIKNSGLGRTNEDQITVADLTGVAIQDIQIAKMMNLALQSGDNE